MKYMIFFVIGLIAFLMACQNARKDGKGLEVIKFAKDSPLEKAGAQIGDYIVAYNKEPVESIRMLNSAKDAITAETVEMLLVRGEGHIKITIPRGRLGAYLAEWDPEHSIDDDAVVIQKIGPLRWESGMENSFLGAVYRLDERFGRGISYEDIVGLSGYGFRLHFFDQWCPSSPDATTGFNSGARILDILGYKVSFYWKEGIQANMDTNELKEYETSFRSQNAMLKLIKNSIDRGYPVIAIDLINNAEWGLITGYQKDGQELFTRCYYDYTKGYDIAERFPWVICVIDDYKEKPLDKEYGKSLKLAKMLYETSRYEHYFNGLKAVEYWISALTNPNFFENMSEEDGSEIMLANWWITQSLKEARGVTANYLRDNIERFGKPNDDIYTLADIYTAEASLLHMMLQEVPNPVNENLFESWSEESRVQQQDMLREFLKMEQNAYGVIKKIN